MKLALKFTLVFLVFTGISFCSVTDTCKTYSISPDRLNQLHELYVSGKLQYNKAFQELVGRADNFLDMTPVSVIDKQQTPPSGSKHDYMSMGPYWWPNPNTKDGLPYIRKDGETNPAIRKITDHSYEGKMGSAVSTLSLAYYITKDPEYSRKASKLLKVWFLDDSTKMNPNLNYAQAIPGICTGRGIGIIEMRNTYEIVDAIGMLETSNQWSKKDDNEIRTWFTKYLDWLRTSKYGKDEYNWKNNHGTWCSVQTVAIALFLGKNELAKKILNEAKTKRIGHQISSDGKQPEELARTKSWGYSVFNLDALFHLAGLGDNVGIDLWNYKNPKGGSIRKALDYVLTHSLEPGDWKYKQIGRIDVSSLYPLLLAAEKKYDKKTYSDWIKRLSIGSEDNQIYNLLYVDL
jgi:Alginate lyase